MTRKERAERTIQQLEAIGFDAEPELKYNGKPDPGEPATPDGRYHTGAVYVTQKGFGHGQIKDLVMFAEHQNHTLRLGGGTLYGGVQVVNVYLKEDV